MFTYIATEIFTVRTNEFCNILCKGFASSVSSSTPLSCPPDDRDLDDSRNNAVFKFFYVSLTVRPCIICFKWSQLSAHYFLVYIVQLLHMFRTTMCPSSREFTVSMRHWYFSLRKGVCLVSRPDRHPYIYLAWQPPPPPPVDHGHLIHAVSRSHTTTHHSW